MDYEWAVVDFLTRPENLPVALEVAGRIEKVKDQLQLRFWQQYRDEMEKRLQATGASERWRIQLMPEQKLLERWAKCRIEFFPPHGQSLHLDVTLEVDNPRDVGNSYYGLHWSEQHSEASDSPTMADIVRSLKEKGLPLNATNSNWWVMHIDLEHRLREDSFLVQFSAEPDQIVAEIGDRVWTFFEHMRAPLEVVNDAFYRRSV